MKDLGELQWFLGIQIIRDQEQRQPWLNQQSYFEGITDQFGLNDHVGRPPTPLSQQPLIKNKAITTQEFTTEYQAKIRSTNYKSIITRPDCTFTSSQLTRFNNNPSKHHMSKIDRYIQFLRRSSDLGIIFDSLKEGPIFEVFTNASFADNLDSQKSSQGYLMKLYRGPVT